MYRLHKRKIAWCWIVGLFLYFLHKLVILASESEMVFNLIVGVIIGFTGIMITVWAASVLLGDD